MTAIAQTTSDPILKRFSTLVASPRDQAGAELTLLTAIGAHLGRRSALVYNGRDLYPTLYSLVVTQPSTLSEWHRYFEELQGAPSVKKSGISRAESLVHLVRNAVVRPDKVYTEPNENPEWRLSMVDEGVEDKRCIVMQRLGPQLNSLRLGARHLLDALLAAYDSGSFSVYLAYRDGGFHSTDTAHIALLLPEPDSAVAAALWDELPLLLAKADNPVVCPDNISKIREVIAAASEAMDNAPSQVTVSPEANGIIQSEITSGRPYAMLTLLRLAHILAVLERSSVATESLVSQAAAIVQASESTFKELGKTKAMSLKDEMVEFVQGTRSDVPGHQIVRRFRRRYRQVEIRLALDELEEGGLLIRRLVKTAGRTREDWSVPQSS